MKEILSLMPAKLVLLVATGAIVAAALIGTAPAGASAQDGCVPNGFPTRLDPDESVMLRNCATMNNSTANFIVVDEMDGLQGGVLVSLLGGGFDVAGAACRTTPGGFGCVAPPYARVTLVDLPRGAEPVAAGRPSTLNSPGGETVAFSNGGAVVNGSRWLLTVFDYGDIDFVVDEGPVPYRQLVLIVANVSPEARDGANCRPLTEVRLDCIIPPGGSVTFVNSQ